MTTASTFWIEEYAAKARSASAFVQSGRSATADPVEFLHTVRRMLTLLKVAPDHVVLDIGCGNGLLALVLSGICSHVTAIERVEALAERARRITGDCDNVDVLTADAAHMSDLGRRYDRILVWEALQLIEPADARGLFERMARWLQPGGRIVLGAVPDRRRRDAFLSAYLEGVHSSTRLSAAEKDAIIARNERAHWYDVAELLERWRQLGGQGWLVDLPKGREKADHRLDLVLTMEAA